MGLKVPDQKELDWIKLRDNLDEIQLETFGEKAVRKFKESPLVPIGCLATATILTIGVYSFFQGYRSLSQKMMRARVVAQGATIIAILASLTSAGQKRKTA